MFTQTPGVVYQTSQESHTLAGILGSLGGHLNLWIGITFFTLVELVELLYHCALVMWRRPDKYATNIDNTKNGSAF